LLGDVALKLNYPEHSIEITSIPDTMKALDAASVSGFVADASGALLEDFTGIVHVKVFDKASQITSLNNDGAPNAHTFEVAAQCACSVAWPVSKMVNLHLTLSCRATLIMTSGQGRISAYAVSDSSDAHGASNDFIIGGISEDFTGGLDPPLVELFINDTLFQSGGLTDINPLLLRGFTMKEESILLELASVMTSV
jgi:hypothetical protein